MDSCSTDSPKAQPAGFPWEQAHLVSADPSRLLQKNMPHLMDKLEADVSATARKMWYFIVDVGIHEKRLNLAVFKS